MAQQPRVPFNVAVGKALELIAHGFEVISLHVAQDTNNPASRDTLNQLTSFARILRDLGNALVLPPPQPSRQPPPEAPEDTTPKEEAPRAAE